jgi:hypothetical protein
MVPGDGPKSPQPPFFKGGRNGSIGREGICDDTVPAYSPLWKRGVRGDFHPSHSGQFSSIHNGFPMLPYQRTLKSRARELRCNTTQAEQVLWAQLRCKQVAGLPFYRQKPIAGYIVDFYCAAARWGGRVGWGAAQCSRRSGLRPATHAGAGSTGPAGAALWQCAGAAGVGERDGDHRSGGSPKHCRTLSELCRHLGIFAARFEKVRRF